MGSTIPLDEASFGVSVRDFIRSDDVPANGIRSGNCILSAENHSFTRDYKIGLNGIEFRRMFDSLRATLVPFGSLTGQGVLQVTLTWPNQPGDVDLHVNEPNGRIVDFRNKVGQSGQLDVDNQISDGPENYFVCDPNLVQTGNYRIYVNYYRGEVLPVTATINFRIGVSIPKTRTVTLTNASSLIEQNWILIDEIVVSPEDVFLFREYYE